ncbi:MAG TPA: SDR family NAD(P)-dependent oxidoreductase [Anaerolineaceae bacterium]|nr:SDR family NAD(P)-dependent oxidoreductase [Anaerolineaceae bacterium]
MKPVSETTQINGNIHLSILITGATNGIGKEVAFELLSQGHHVIIHGRNPKKIEQFVSEALTRVPDARIDTILADFSSLKEVKTMAEELKERFSHLDVLINNAGVYCNKRCYSAEGFELAFAVNYLASFTLTLQLIPLLAKSQSARIINMSSVGHRYVWINPLDIQSRHFFWGWVNYCRSKLLHIPFTFRLAEFLEGSNITVNALHPGVIIGTEVTNTAFIKWGLPLKFGAATVINLATNPDLDRMNGMYIERYRISRPSPMALDKSLKSRLWTHSFKWAGLNQEECEQELITLSRSGR